MNNPIHAWFSLSYANYLVCPRLLLQSMPNEWQQRFVELMKEYDEKYSHIDIGEYEVTLVNGEHDVLANYKYGQVPK